MPEAKLSKADFIRSMPNAKPSEIVAAAKSKGLVFSPEYVGTIRGLDRRNKKGGKSGGGAKSASKGVTKPAAKSAHAAPRGGSGMTPSDFIRSMPNASPAQILEAAKKAGLTFSRSLIYMVRTNSGKGGGGSRGGARKGGGGQRAAASRPATAVRSPGGGGSDRDVSFRRMVIDIGVGRAQSLLEDVRRGLEEIAGG